MLANEAAQRSLLRIAEMFRMQLRAAGPLTFRKDDNPSSHAVLNARIVFTQAYFQLLEEAADLRFQPGETPLLYNTTTHWPAEAMPAGWSDEGCAVKPSDLVLSLHGVWRGHLPEHAMAMRRFLKAALWVMRSSGVVEALRYLFALHRFGFAVGPLEFGSAVNTLLRAYRSVERDEDVPAFFFGSTIPSTPHDLIHADFVEPPSHEFRRPLGEDVLAALFDEAQMQIDRARNAADYDEWLVAQAVLYGVTWIVKHMLEDHGPKNLGVHAFIDQLEELRADAGSQVQGSTVSSFRENLSTLPRALRLILAHKLGAEGARQHVMECRAPFPPALADLVFAGKPLPPPWDAVSPRLAPVYARLLTDIEPTLVRTRGFTDVPAEEQQAAAVTEHREGLLAAMRQGDAGAHAEAVASVRSLLELYPWSSFVHYELGIALDQSGDPERALHHIEMAIALAPTRKEHWQSLGVVLNRLGARDEAGIAKYVGAELLGKKR